MYTDKKKLYSITISVLALLLLAFFLPGEHSGRIAGAILLAPSAAVIWFFIKKRSILSINKKMVTVLLSVIGLLYAIIYLLVGLYFGFHRNLYFFDLGYVIPTAVIILATEIIRSVVLAQENKAANVLCYVICVIAESLSYGNIYYIVSFNRFMDFVALTVFPAIVANLLYHYLSRRYGILPNVIYRLITTLIAYLIPSIPSIPASLHAFTKLFIPIIIYFFIDSLYERKKRYALAKKSKLAPIITALALIIVIGFVALISNQFQYGALVIATESMTGELNKGDVSIFESYDGQTIEKGQVIIFEKDGSMIVHRVVDIQRINGQNQYFTKGDANEYNDSGFVTKSQIVGLVNFKIPYLGYPTLWLRSLFDR